MWEENLVIIVRGLIGDDSQPYTYTDDRLQQLICIAATLVLSDVSFDYTYTVTLNCNTISPDPVSSGDDDFIALVALKAACMILSSDYKNSACKAISVKDGPSSIDMRDVVKYKKDIAEGACEAYDKARTNYLIGDGSVGRSIVGPYNAGMTDGGQRFN